MTMRYEQHPSASYPPADPYDGSYYDMAPRPRWGLVVVVSALVSALVAAAVAFAVVVYIQPGSGGGEKVAVPAVKGMSLSQALQVAQNFNLTVRVAGTENDNKVPKDKILHQIPDAGNVLKAGAAVMVTLSSGPAQITVPMLKNQRVDQAQKRLREMGLEFGRSVYKADDSVAEGWVLGSDPAAGTEVTAGTTVNLVLAQRDEGATDPASAEPPPSIAHRLPISRPKQQPVSRDGMVTVPKVTGVRLQYARPRLNSRGLTVGRIRYDEDLDHMEDMVLGQTPGSGATLLRGGSVDLVVNRHNY